MNWLIYKLVIGYLKKIEKQAKGGSMNGKNILKSKTLWANVLAVALLIGQQVGGVSPANLDPQTQGIILAVINIVLRFLTKQPVKL